MPMADCINSTALTTSNGTMTTSSLYDGTSLEEDFLTTITGSDDYSEITRSPFEDGWSWTSFLNGTTIDNMTIANRTTLGPSRLKPKTIKKAFSCPEGQEDISDRKCYLHTYDTPFKQIRGVLEVVLVLWSIVYILIAVRELTFLPLDIFMQNMVLCPSRVVFLIGCFLLLGTVPLRLACEADLENKLAILVMLMTGFYFLFYGRGFKLTGPFVIMTYRMISNDLLKFGIMYGIFVMGFAQAYYIIYQSHSSKENSNPMKTPIEAILKVFIMSLGSFGDVWGSLEETNHSFIGKLLCFLFLALVYILLVNLLIAMMGDTYTRIAEIKNEWMRQWARTVLIVERGIPPKERLRQQNLYSERMATGEKALVLKQTMSIEQLEEIKDIIEMKVAHRKNILRRKDRFGYESNSLIGLNLGDANVIAPEADDDEEDQYN